MTNPAATSRSTALDTLNAVLIRLLLMPVADINALVGGSDAYLVYSRLVAAHRSVSTRGWYCFNRRDRVSLPYTAAPTDAYVVSDVMSVNTTPRQPADPLWPQVRMKRVGPNSHHLYRLDNGATAFAESERTILFDVIYGVAFDEAPEVFTDYIGWIVTNELSPLYGVAPRKAEENAAMDALTMYELDFLPLANVYTDTVDALMLWANR